MARTIASLSVSINASTRGLRSGLRRASKQVETFAENTRRTLTGIGKIGAVGIGAAAAGVTLGLQKQFASLDGLAKTADKLGAVPTNLIALRDAAQLSGVSIGTLDQGLQRMVRWISEAAKGTGEAKDAIKELGLNAVTLNTRRPAEQMEMFAAAFAKVESPADRVRLAMKLFDTEGVSLVNTLKLLSDKGLKSFIDDVKKSGRVITRDQLKPIEDVNDKFTQFGNRIEGLFTRLSTIVAEPFSKALDKITQLLDSEDTLKNIDDAFKGFASSVATFSTNLAEAVANYDELKKRLDGGTSRAGSVAARVVKGIGTFIGGAAAATAENFRGGNIAGTPGKKIFDQALDDAAKILRPARDELFDLGMKLEKGIGELGESAAKSINEASSRAVNRLEGAINGAIDPAKTGAKVFRLERSGGQPVRFGAALGADLRGGPQSSEKTQLQLLEETKKQTQLLREGPTGFGVNPASLPAGTMIIKVAG